MPSDDSSFWSTLEELAHQGPANVQSIWVWLAQKLDLAQSRPQAADGVIVSQLTDRDGPYYILKNPATKTYFRLSDRDHFLWQRMDGNHTVKDMVVAYFMEYKVLAFARVGVLLEGLKSAVLLTEQPVNVYQQVRTQLDRRDPQKRLADLGKILLEKQFPIRGVDRLLTSLYKLGGWLFYTPPAQILWLLVTVAGLVCFSIVMADKGYGIVAIRGNYLLGVISLIAVYILSMFVHEIAHGLTVKHYHREVPRGGLMIYFGFMTFFVDTSDIWMEGKRPRLAVTWAGPYANLILAGAASLAMITWPSFLLNPLLFQFSFITYLNVLLNLNPLLELDGYFLLMDFLEIPMLRRKSLEFIRHGIWAKFKVMRAGGKKVWGWFGEFIWLAGSHLDGLLRSPSGGCLAASRGFCGQHDVPAQRTGRSDRGYRWGDHLGAGPAHGSGIHAGEPRPSDLELGSQNRAVRHYVAEGGLGADFNPACREYHDLASNPSASHRSGSPDSGGLFCGLQCPRLSRFPLRSRFPTDGCRWRGVLAE
jgi:Zn-dependent protease